MGCVRMTEACLHSDPPAAEELSQAISIVEIHLDDVVREIPEADGGRHVRRPRRHGQHRRRGRDRPRRRTTATASTTSCSPRPAVEDVFRTLATEPLADRIHNPGLERERADVIVGGCACSCRSCGASASTSASCRRPTSSTAWRCRSPRARDRVGRPLSRPSPAPRSERVARIAARDHPLRPPRAAAPPRGLRLPRLARGPAPQRRLAHQVGAHPHPRHARRRRGPRGLLGALQRPPARAPARRRLRLRGVRRRRVRRRDQPVVGAAGPVPERLRRLLDRRGQGRATATRPRRWWWWPASPSRSCACTASRSPSSPATGPAAG